MRRRRGGDDDDSVFERAVRDVAVRLSAAVVRYDPLGEVELSGAHFAGTVDLRAVRQLCRSRPRGEWPGIVLEHLAGLAGARVTPLDLTDLAGVRPRLLSRLYAEAEFLLSDVTARTVAPGVSEALVVYADGAISTLPRAVTAEWPVPVEVLYAEARERVRSREHPQARQVDLGGLSITAVEGSSYFTTTALFWLAEVLPVAASGALVALPNRHLLLGYPVAGPRVLDAAQAMLVNAVRLHDQGPGSLSPHLYWWHEGGLTLLPATVDTERIEFSPPVEFVRVLDELG